MLTRKATHEDTGNITKFLAQYHVEKSNLQDIPFNKESMTKAIGYYISNPRHVVFVAEDNEEITGVLMGSIEPFVFNEKRHWATDLVFVATKGGAWLLKKFLAWAKLYKVDRIIMGVSTDMERSDELYAAVGMHRVGGMHVLNFGES